MFNCEADSELVRIGRRCFSPADAYPDPTSEVEDPFEAGKGFNKIPFGFPLATLRPLRIELELDSLVTIGGLGVTAPAPRSRLRSLESKENWSLS